MKDMKDIIEEIKKYPLLLKDKYKHLNDNDEVVLATVNSDGDSLRFASLRLKDNKKIVMIAVNNNFDALEHVSPRLKKDILSIINKEYQNMEDIIREIEKNPSLLRDKYKHLNDKEEVVIAAVSNFGGALKYASTRLRNNKKILILRFIYKIKSFLTSWKNKL